MPIGFCEICQAPFTVLTGDGEPGKCIHCLRIERVVLLALHKFGMALPQPPSQARTFAVWRCLICGCLWRDNLDDSVSLLDLQQRSCNSCEAGPVQDACEIYWLDEDGDVAAPSGSDTFES